MLLRRLRIHLQCRRPRFDSWVTQIPWRRDRLPTPVFLGFPGDSEGKESACKVGDLGSIPGLGRSSRGGHGNPLRILAWRISMDRGAWQAMGSQRVGHDQATFTLPRIASQINLAVSYCYSLSHKCVLILLHVTHHIICIFLSHCISGN